jgi:hypothetical protein
MLSTKDGPPVADLTLYRSLAGALQYLTLTWLMPFNKFAYICMTLVSLILLSSNVLCGISKALWSMVVLSLTAGRMICSSGGAWGQIREGGGEGG